MNDFADAVRLPSDEESIAPVTILDAQGHVVRIQAAAEFRRTHVSVAASRYPTAALRRQGRGDGRAVGSRTDAEFIIMGS